MGKTKKKNPLVWIKNLFSYSRYLRFIRRTLLVKSEEEYKVRRKLLVLARRPRMLSFPVAKRILVCSPHPDDESVGAGGLLWAHRNVSEIHIIVFSNGECGGALEGHTGDSESYTEAILNARKEEFLKTSEMLNVKSLHFLNLADGKVSFSPSVAETLLSLAKKIQPDLVILPHFLDGHRDHRAANIIYGYGCASLETMVLGYEVWNMLEPNAIFDISEHLEGKLSLVRNYKTQLRTIDYINYVKGLSGIRAFQYHLNPQRNGAAEAYLLLPNRQYCKLVQRLYSKRHSF